MKTKTLLSMILVLFSVVTIAQTPVNWFVDTPSPGDISLAPNTENFSEGTKSCELTLHTTNVPYFKSDNFAVNAGANYTYSVDVYDNDTRGRLKIYCDFYDAEGNDIYGEAPVYTEDMDSWQTITWSAVVPEDAVHGYVWIKFYDQDEFVDEAVILVDNAIFIEDGSTNAVVNGGLEEWSTLEMEKAYCVSNDAVDVRFNGAVESVNAADFTLSGTGNASFSNAEIDAEDATLVHLSGCSDVLDFDLVVDQLTMAGKEVVLDFYAGIAPIAFTNEVNPDGTIELGIPATFEAVVSADDAYNNVWVHDAEGAYNGILVFSYSFVDEVELGDNILFSAELDIYHDLSELVSPVLLASESGVPFASSVIMGTDINNTLAPGTEVAEMWEGQLITIYSAQVLEYNADEYYYICSDDEGDTQFKVGDNVDYELANVTLTVGEYYNITGVVDTNWDIYRINPRDADDATLTTGISFEEEVLFNIYPNPATDYINVILNEEAQKVIICDLTGKVVLEAVAENLNNLVLDVKQFNPGIYMINVISSVETRSQKLVIN